MGLGKIIFVEKRALEEIIEDFVHDRLESAIEFRGYISGGVGRGRYYVMEKYYYNVFRYILGSEPFPGTLNIRYDRDISYFIAENYIYLKPAYTVGDTERYGSVRIYLGQLFGDKILAVIPEKTQHKNCLEIVSHICLREKYRLKDGDSVSITLFMI